MRKTPLEICLYVAGAGAFGVLLRWLQNQLAFNDLGLADPSAFHVLVPGFILACCVVFWRFIRQMDEQALYLPQEICPALGSKVRLHALLRRAAGVVMILGGLLLFAKSETDKFSGMYRVLSALAVLSGISYPLVLAEAEREKPRPLVLCPLMMLPMLLYAVWLVVSYRSNAINSVPLAYGLDMAVSIVAMVAYFRMAGFAFGAPKIKRCLFDAMLCAALCIMSLADGRYLGMEIILLASAGQMVLYTWIMVQNLRQGDTPGSMSVFGVIPKKEEKNDDGFEHL